MLLGNKFCIGWPAWWYQFLGIERGHSMLRPAGYLCGVLKYVSVSVPTIQYNPNSSISNISRQLLAECADQADAVRASQFSVGLAHNTCIRDDCRSMGVYMDGHLDSTAAPHVINLHNSLQQSHSVWPKCLARMTHACGTANTQTWSPSCCELRRACGGASSEDMQRWLCS